MCAKCRLRVLGWIADLPNLYRRLGVAVVPGSTPGERVRSSSPGSRTPAAVSALALRGTSQRMAQPDWRRPEGWTPEEADLSIPEWVDGWVRVWRQRNRHHRPSLVDASPAVTRLALPAPRRPVIRNEGGDLLPPDEVRQRLNTWASDLARWQQVRAAAAADGARVQLGIGAALPESDRPGDPQAERLGEVPRSFAVGVGCGYLAAWFERIADDGLHPDLGVFTAGLRTLVGRARSALGERSDLVYLCRCPEPFYDRETGERRPCGAHLVADAFVDRIACRRCRTEWPKERWLFLCAQSRETWPAEAPTRRTWEAAS